MWYYLVKRLIDLVGAALGLILSAPIFLAIAAIIKLDSPGPIFADEPYRVGKDGKIFRMYKFRSMVKGAHSLLRKDPKFKALYEKYLSNSFKIPTSADPRITPIGRFIRRTSLDELPQLINILKGEMSLVGPRAFHVDELAQQRKKFPVSENHVKIALKVKPGLTGLWQVSGRSAVAFPERVKLDAFYAAKKSTLTDIAILVKTIPTIFKGEGI